MNPSTEGHAFDARAQALHARAVHQVPARTLRELRVRRAAASPVRHSPRRLAWPMAAACAAMVAVVAVLLQPGGTLPAPAAETQRMATLEPALESGGEAYAALDEDPELYLWLASQDALPLAME